MEPSDASQPLINDPAREAAASMRGYWAQVWRSVLVWMDLADTERLYLEGAEDIDRVDGFTAEAVQVKDTGGNVTLRSADVIEAIDNAWANQERNPTHTIKFRFLTTSGIGVEQGAPFGAKVGGLTFWNASRRSRDTAEQGRTARVIADFLLSEGKVSEQVKAFLGSAENAEIWRQLIAPVEWDTDADDALVVIQDVEDRLVVLGEKHGVTPDKSSNVADHLYATAFATATQQKDRYLTRASLLRLFHDRTHVSMPAGVASALMASIPQHLRPIGPLPSAIGGKAGLVGRPPPLSARYYERQAVMADISIRLASSPVLVLQGGTGTGKSVAAVGHTTTSTLSWGWVDLRGMQAVADVLDRVADELTAEDGLKLLVLDDIEIPEDSRAMAAPLSRIVTILNGRDGQLLITSAVALPQRLALALALPANGTIPMPAFSRIEIAAFLMARGCLGENVATWWAAFIELHTSGHAQLVHARVATLESQGFPKPDMEGVLTTPSDVVEARTEARRLIGTLDSSSRDMVYRLSLTTQTLPQRQVFAIAALPPTISEPGLVLDKLVGPWLEVVGDGFYRVSPLLRGVGAEVQGVTWSAAMHKSIAEAVLSFGTLSPTDVSTILLHSMLAQDWSAVVHLALGILGSDNETWEALAQSAGWFVMVGTGTAMRPNADEFTLIIIRLLQFRLAAAGHDNEGAASVIACMDEELPATVDGMPLRLARHFFLGQVLLRTELQLPMTQFVPMGLEYIRLSDELKGLLANIHDAEAALAMTGPDGGYDLASVASFSISQLVTDRHSLSVLLKECEIVDIPTARRLLWFFGGQTSVARLVLDRVWLAELKAPSPDWIACREVFEAAYHLGRRYGLPGLTHGAARAIVRLTDENLRDPAGALQRADIMAKEVGSSPDQDDARASILLRMGNSGDALAIWRELLPRWISQNEFDHPHTFSHRLAAIAAARLGLWGEAADFLSSARALAVADGDTQAVYRAGLTIDEGFARWKAGDNRRALDTLVEGVQAIELLPSDDTDERAYLLRKRAGHTIMWIANVAAGKPPKEFSEPPPACSSGLDTFDGERIPSTPADAMWVQILEFEFIEDLGDTHFLAQEARLKASPYGLMRVTFDLLRLQHRLRSLAIHDLAEVANDWADSFALSRRYYITEGLGPSDPLPNDAPLLERDQAHAEVVLTVMLSGVFALAARGAVTKEILNQWSSSAGRAGLSLVVDPWIDFVAALFIDQSIDAGTAVRDRSQTWPWRATASIRVAIARGIDPAELLTMHNYWGSILPKTPVTVLALADVERLVVLAWLRLGQNRFLLRSPTLTVPVLEQACASTGTGWRKIGAVLLAACDVVPDAVPSDFRPRFQGLQSLK